MNKVIIIAFLLISAMVWMVYVSVDSLQEKKERELNQQRLTSISNMLRAESLEYSKPTVLVYFNSECQHCQWEIKALSEHIQLFEDCQLLLVSHETKSRAKYFLDQYGLSEYYLNVPVDRVMSTFSGNVPQVFIYVDNQLVQQYMGEVKIEAIMESLTNR